MRVTYLGHAALMAEVGGKRLLMDPWLEDPAYMASWWHFPPLALKLKDLGALDYVWCSHDHPDHFDPKTLLQLPKDTCFLVPQFTSKTLERRYAELGFTNLVPLTFGETVELEGGLRVTNYRTDLVWEDSSLVVEGDGTSLFNMNDCKLSEAAMREIGERHEFDIAFLPFSGAIQFPTCYEMSETRKRELCATRRQGHLDAIVERAKALGTKRVVPFAGNFCLPAPDQAWMNEINNINTPDEAVAALEAGCPDVEPVQMNPGDRWSVDGGLERLIEPPVWSRRLQLVEEMSRTAGAECERLRANEAPARPSLGEDFQRYARELAAQHDELPGRIDANVVFDVRGENGGVWTLCYRADGLEIHEGAHEEWDLRMEMPGTILQQLIDGDVIWDEALISFRIRFAENPEFFNEPFWAMLYSPCPEFMREYIEFDRPLAMPAEDKSGD